MESEGCPTFNLNLISDNRNGIRKNFYLKVKTLLKLKCLFNVSNMSLKDIWTVDQKG